MNKITLIIVLFLTTTYHGYCQNISQDRESNTSVQESNEYLESKQWKRREWFLKPRMFGLEDSKVNIRLKTFAEYEKYKRSNDSRSVHGNWLFLGPTYNSSGQGRLNCIAINPTNDNIIYVGSSNGGLWKTINGGISWTNITPDLPLLAVADIEFDPNNPDILFLLSGDGNTGVPGIGVFKSEDAGNSWKTTGYSFDITSGHSPTKLLIHPNNVNIQYIASNAGIIRTDDSWDTWTIVSGVFTYDIEFKPGDPDIMYSSGPFSFRRSTNNGLNWTTIFDNAFSFSFTDNSRAEIAVSPSNDESIYLLQGDWDGENSIYYSPSSGIVNSWVLMDSMVVDGLLGGQARYNIALAADPNNHTNLFAGMVGLGKSSNLGITWSPTQGQVHSDFHDIQFNNGNIYVACDGGIYKSSDNGQSWTDLSTGLAITEIYRISGTPQNVDRFVMGTQDNASMRRATATTAFQVFIPGFDGMECRIDQNNLNIVYGSSQNGNFAKSLAGGEPGTFVDFDTPTGGNWITPIILDQSITGRLFVGEDSIFRSDNGGNSWQFIGNPSINTSPNSSSSSCLAQGISNPDVLYESSFSFIYRTDDALVASGPASWTNISSGLPSLFITDIQVDPSNASRVFVTLSGYQDGQKVFKSENGGSTWDNISGTIPNIPANCFAFAGQGIDAMYVGTDIGVFYKDNNLDDWIYFSNNHPSVSVSDLYYNPTNNSITSGTYGRGLWRSSGFSDCPIYVTLSGDDIGGELHYSASNSIYSDAEYKSEIGTNIRYNANEYILLVDGFQISGHATFQGKLEGCVPPYSSLTSSPTSTSKLKLNSKTKIPIVSFRYK